MPSSADWSHCILSLNTLLEQIASAQEAAGAGASTADADAFALRCAELAKNLGKLQPGLAQALNQGTPPAEVMVLLQQVKTGLNSLQDHTTRLQAGASRALNVLFPADQVQAYSRLGNKGYGAAAKPGSGYLKA